MTAARPGEGGGVDFGVVVLTMGKRPEDLAAGVASLLAQEGVVLDIIVVGNGWQPDGLPQAVQCLGLVQPRVVDPSGLASPGRWVPRLRVGDPAAPGPATSLWEGAVAMRRSVFDAVGGWPDPFFYAHEGIEVVWRTWDVGSVAWYAGDLVVNHPVIDPARHEVYYRLNARNRVWLARRNLPLLLEPLYVGTWVALTVLRMRDREALRAWFGGLREGLSVNPGGRRRMRWRTVWAMTRAGRPPII